MILLYLRHFVWCGISWMYYQSQICRTRRGKNVTIWYQFFPSRLWPYFQVSCYGIEIDWNGLIFLVFIICSLWNFCHIRLGSVKFEIEFKKRVNWIFCLFDWFWYCFNMLAIFMPFFYNTMTSHVWINWLDLDIFGHSE